MIMKAFAFKQKSYLSGEDLATFHSYTGETDGTLTTLVMLFGKIHRKLVDNFLGTALDLGVEGSLTVND
jgi:hypothetical protein